MAGGSIADLFFRALLDSRQLELDAVKAGDKAGQTMGGRMSSAIGLAMRAGLGVVSAGAAIATKGLIELDNTMAQFTADTGLAGEAADDAKKSILAMSGRNLQPMKEIGAVLGKVHTDLGLTGEAADETAEQFLHFARITKRDASEEVAAFDDILDAWGLTADKSGGIMDQLVKSHQTFGGSIADDEEALKNLAPAMKALNFGIDDSIGLLNLFKSKGLDAATSQRAFNTAVKNLPPGTKLEDVLEKIQAIEDPSKRAAAAIEIFGSKGGVALANALGPGIGSLDDFKITQEEANGAMEAGREAIDGTFGNWAQLQLKGFTTKLTELGSSFGPAVTGLASLGTLAGSLGFGKLGTKLSQGIAGAWKSVASSALVTGAISKVSSMAATLYLKTLMFGDAISGAVSKGWQKIASSALVSGAISKVGGLAATAYLKALIFGDAIGNAMSAAWSKAGPIATKAAGGVGKALGTTAGKAFSVAFAVTAVFMFLDELEKQKAQLAAEAETFWDPINEQIATGATDGLQQSRGAINAAIEDITHDLNKMAISGPALEILRAQLAAIDAALVSQADSWGVAFRASERASHDTTAGIAATAGQITAAVNPSIKAFTDLGYSADQARELVGSDAKVLGDKVVGAFGVMVPEITDGAEAWEKYRDDVQAAQQQAITDQLDFTSKALSDLQGFQSGVETALSGVYSAENDATITKNRIIILEAQLTASRKEQQEKGAKITAAERADYQNNRIAIEGELEQLKLHAALIGDDMHRVTALNALLTAKDLKSNLTSENDNIRLAAEAQRDKIIGYLIDLSTQGGPAAQNAATIVAQWMNPNNPLSPLAAVDTYGQNLGTDFADGISSKDEAARRAAMDLTDPVKDQMHMPNAYTWGNNAGGSWVDGMADALARHARIVEQISEIKGAFKAGSPPGPKSPLHLIDVWGAKTGQAWADALVAQVKAAITRVREPLDGLGSALSQPMAGPEVASTEIAKPVTQPVRATLDGSDAIASAKTVGGAIADALREALTGWAGNVAPTFRRLAEEAGQALQFTAPTVSPIAVAAGGLLGRPAVPFAGPDGYGGPVGGAGGSVTNVNVTVPGLLRAETPADVVRTLRHLNVYGTFGEERK